MQHLVATGYGARERWRRHRGAYRSTAAELVAQERWAPEQLEADQLARLRRWLDGAREVPHVGDALRDAGLDPRDLRSIEDLAALPLLDKADVRAAPERFRSPTARTLWPQRTGGTTGSPLTTWATPAAVQRNYATFDARGRRWLGADGRVRTASFQGQVIVPADQRRPPYWRRNLAADQLYLSVHHLADATVADYVGALERFRPVHISGYPTAVHRVARHLLETGDVGRVAPRSVLLAGEQLWPDVAADIARAFGGATVGQTYGMSELVAFASTCPEGHLHLSTEYGVVELVDTPASAGMPGLRELVATSLINDGTPLVRYRTADLAERIATEAASCGIGLPVLEGLTGRVDDVLVTPEGVALGPSLVNMAFKAIPHLRRAQLHQSTPAALTVLVEVAPGWSAEDEGALREELRRRLGPTIVVEVEVVARIEATAGGKDRLLVSSVPRP